MARGKRRSEGYSTWLVPDFPSEVRARFLGLCKILNREVTEMVEEAISEWTMNHADELVGILREEREYLEAREAKYMKEVAEDE